MAKGRAKKWLLWSGIAGALALVLLLAVAVPTGSLEEPLFSIGPGMTEEEEGRTLNCTNVPMRGFGTAKSFVSVYESRPGLWRQSQNVLFRTPCPKTVCTG
jgi:hypothetical protein